MVSKNNLDKRICDVELFSDNTQTYREFIRDSESEFGLECKNLDEIDELDLLIYFEYLDYLWER